MPRQKTQLTPDLAARAAVLRARHTVEEIDTLRLVSDSVAAGISQGAVAEALGASQATISRLVAKIAEQPRTLVPSVDEIVSRAVIKDIDRSQMVEALKALKIAYAPADKRPHSEWAKLRTAIQSGLVTKTEAKAVAEATAARMVARVTHSMDLEAQAVPDESTKRMLRQTTEKLVAGLG